LSVIFSGSGSTAHQRAETLGNPEDRQILLRVMGRHRKNARLFSRFLFEEMLLSRLGPPQRFGLL